MTLFTKMGKRPSFSGHSGPSELKRLLSLADY